jgi:hypothetical protein
MKEGGGTLGRNRHCPRSAAMSKTSRSRFAKPVCWNTSDVAELFNVLRLVLYTQPRSNPVAFGAGTRG